VPSCCGRALPHSVLERVLTKEETNIVAQGASTTPDTPFRDSGYCEIGLSINPPRSSNIAPLPDTPPTLPMIPTKRTRYEAISIDSALANEAFKSFKTQQKEQFERVSTFECSQRKALSAHHQLTMTRLKAQHKANKIERLDKV
jgi:hypothetical protein